MSMMSRYAKGGWEDSEEKGWWDMLRLQLWNARAGWRWLLFIPNFCLLSLWSVALLWRITRKHAWSSSLDVSVVCTHGANPFGSGVGCSWIRGPPGNLATLFLWSLSSSPGPTNYLLVLCMFSHSNSFLTGILNLFTNWMTSLTKSWHLSINIVCPVHCLLSLLPEPFVVNADLLQVIPSETRGSLLVFLVDFFFKTVDP